MKKYVVSLITNQSDADHNMVSAPIQANSVEEAVGKYILDILMHNPKYAIVSVKYVEV